MSAVAWLPAVLAAWIVGGLPVGLWIARWWGETDVRRHGSGGTGMTNVGRVVGPAAGRWVVALDFAKGALAVWIALRLAGGTVADPVALLAGFVAVLGNVAPPLARFRGGKGVATAAGVLALVSPASLVACVLAFAIAVSLTRIVSAGSIAAAVTLPFAVCAVRALVGAPMGSAAAFAVATSLLVLWRHRENVARLRRGREPRIGTPRRGSDDAAAGGPISRR